MNIVSSISYYTPYVSGLTICTKRIAEGLVKRNHTVMILTNQHDRTLPIRSRIRGVAVIRSPYLIRISKGFLSFDWLIRPFAAISASDRVIINLPQPEGIIPALYAKLCGKKIIVVYHCELTLPSGLVNQVIQWGIDVIHRWICAMAYIVVVYTRDYADHSRVLSYFQSKLRVIMPPITRPITTSARLRSIQKSIGSADIVIGVAARLAREKGFEVLFRALPIVQRRFPKKRIVIAVAGPMDPVGEEHYRQKILGMVHRLGKSIRFLGTIPEFEMGSFYQCITMLVVSSVNSTEAFGLVQVEAMMMGKPVVATNLPGVRVPVQMTHMGKIVAPGDYHALAQAISEIIRHRKRFVTSMFEIRKLFRIDRSIASYETVLLS